MQRLCPKLRLLAAQSSQTHPSLAAARRLVHYSSPVIHFSSSRSSFRTLLSSAASSSSDRYPSVAISSFRLSPVSLSLVQVRHVSSRERAKRRKPMTPRTSKLKKTKMKSYSSYKGRFRAMADGKIRRWKEGKRHNAHLKSRKSRARLRQPGIVPDAYAKVMKKLNFFA